MSKFRCLRIFLVIATVAIGAIAANADVPGQVNYQGRLTDAAGDPVADGSYGLVFSLYNDTLAGDQFWTESHAGVKVIDGLFNVVLGSTTPIPSSIIDTANVFLEIVVGSETIEPRTRLISVPYALAAREAVSLNNESFIDEAGDTLRGILQFYGSTASGGQIQVGADYANLTLSDNGDVKTRFYGQDYGEGCLYDHAGELSVSLVASTTGGGSLRLYDVSGNYIIGMFGGPTSDNNALVDLPSGSIDADELMNEPGIVSNVSAASVNITSVFTDIQTVSITIPYAGYIYLAGTCYIKIESDTAMTTGAYVQIDETEGGTTPSSDGVRYYFPSNDFDAIWRTPVSVNRVYYKAAAGTYEFRLEAKKYSTAVNSTIAYNGQLIAIYVPTSYGSVKTFVSDPGENPDAVPVTVLDENINATGETEYRVDLRYYELKAKQARIEALEAERELQKARDLDARR